jgi:hypothetical protein
MGVIDAGGAGLGAGFGLPTGGPGLGVGFGASPARCSSVVMGESSPNPPRGISAQLPRVAAPVLLKSRPQSAWVVLNQFPHGCGRGLTVRVFLQPGIVGVLD